MAISGYCADALQWWLEEQNKFKKCTVRTRSLPDNTYELYEWQVNGVSKPTDAEVEQIMVDYKATLGE